MSFSTLRFILEICQPSQFLDKCAQPRSFLALAASLRRAVFCVVCYRRSMAPWMSTLISWISPILLVMTTRLRSETALSWSHCHLSTTCSGLRCFVQEVFHAARRLLPMAVDPSPHIPYWDVLRHVLHVKGKVCLCSCESFCVGGVARLQVHTNVLRLG